MAWEHSSHRPSQINFNIALLHSTPPLPSATIAPVPSDSDPIIWPHQDCPSHHKPQKRQNSLLKNTAAHANKRSAHIAPFFMDPLMSLHRPSDYLSPSPLRHFARQPLPTLSAVDTIPVPYQDLSHRKGSVVQPSILHPPRASQAAAPDSLSCGNLVGNDYSDLGVSNHDFDHPISNLRASSINALPPDSVQNLASFGRSPSIAHLQVFQNSQKAGPDPTLRLIISDALHPSSSQVSFKLPFQPQVMLHPERHPSQHLSQHLSQQTPLNLSQQPPLNLSQQTPLNQTPSNQSQSGQHQRSISNEEHLLATKLKETYKNIVSYEEVVQKHCIQVSAKISHLASSLSHEASGTSQTSPPQLSPSRTAEVLHDLWTVYHHNITLLENYYDFLVAALKPPSPLNASCKTGRNIVELYKIPRRMWVYGIVGFLEVLKNIMTIFQEHEICLCFIAFCFSIISILTDPNLEMEGWWLEKLGDLSRMAIALYASKFIDWKISAEFWYATSLKTLYGHGKIYYHMCTVQQDNLDALVNIGKSVFCRDPFVPTQHYLRLVVENICSARNVLPILELPIIDFIKIHKVLLSIFSSDPANHTDPSQIQFGIDLVTKYGLTFGSDPKGFNYFSHELLASSPLTSDANESLQPFAPHPFNTSPPQANNSSLEKTSFWFLKGPCFAIANINHLVGFGDSRNPLARVFHLPEALKERRSKKDRKRKGRIVNPTEDVSSPPDLGSATDLSPPEWFYSLKYLNKSVVELSMRILNHYLIGPKAALSGHIIVWLYFLVSLGKAMDRAPLSNLMFSWLFKTLFPWELLINYCNSVLAKVRSSPAMRLQCQQLIYLQVDCLDHFNNHESLPEVWKCWGTLWFDLISEKEDFITLQDAGVLSHDMFDQPTCGTSALKTSGRLNDVVNDFGDNDRLVRIVLLARTIADDAKFVLARDESGFKYDNAKCKSTDEAIQQSNHDTADLKAIIEEFLLSDGRFVHNNFMQPITALNFNRALQTFLPSAVDDCWFAYESMENDNGNGPVNGHGGPTKATQNGLTKRRSQPFNASEMNRASHPGKLNAPTTLNPKALTHFGLFPNPSELPEGNFGDNIDTRITRITLDTNIWLKHCGRIFKCIKNGIIMSLIPLIVFQELRALRKSTDATIADSATRLVIIVRELYASRHIVPLRFDGTVATDINETREFETNANWRSDVDDTILNLVSEHDSIARRVALTNSGANGAFSKDQPVGAFDAAAKNARSFRYCVLITDDRNMRLRSKTLGLTSFQSKWLFANIEKIASERCID